MPNVRHCSFAGHMIELVAYMRLPHAWFVIATCSLFGCMLDSSPKIPSVPPPVSAADGGIDKKRSPVSTSVGQPVQAGSSSKRDTAPSNTAGSQAPAAAAADDDAGASSDMPDASGGAQVDAGATDGAPTDPTDPSEPTTPTDPAPPDTTVTTAPSGDPECTREVLHSKADAYFDAMASGETAALRLHASLRYTENGKDTVLGAGIWLRRPRKDFTRHVLDERNCSTLTQGVVSALTARIVVGVRLRYLDGQLLEVEAQTVPDDATLTNIDAIIPTGADRWLTPVPEDVRMSRDMLERFAEQYFNAATGGGTVPPSASECRRRQNGIPMAQQGSCTVAPGSMRFEQRRFAVIDELSGILTAAVLYDNHLGFYLFKMSNDTVLNIEVVGGATVVSSGW